MSKKAKLLVLAIETSCDDTSVALVDSDGHLIGMESENQDAVHSPYGGVIPELACRNHTLRLLPLVERLMDRTKIGFNDVDGIAVTSKPGLIGSLLVGMTTAKTLAYLHDLPLIGVNHLEGHLHAPLLRMSDYAPTENFDYPFVGLCVSGGHTSLYHVSGMREYKQLGRTLDDAAGEAFDKFGKILGLGYPAGHLVDKRARKGDVAFLKFPRALLKPLNNLDFSFSGLKTAGALEVQKKSREGLSDLLIDNFCASYQEAIIDVLVEKLKRALKQTRLKRAVISGGVSANSRLREKAVQWARRESVDLLIPPSALCTDNAGMIGYVGAKRLALGERDSFDLNAEASTKVSVL